MFESEFSRKIERIEYMGVVDENELVQPIMKVTLCRGRDSAVLSRHRQYGGRVPSSGVPSLLSCPLCLHISVGVYAHMCTCMWTTMVYVMSLLQLLPPPHSLRWTSQFNPVWLD